ncbi:MAG: ABC transporter substrate-binding protein [Lachnospiraceae bacterium]|nr:ABC transporter substrate-binding protein [Lachnospiraceae bacterium]
MKKTLVLLTSLTMAFALTACGGGDTSTSATSAAQTEAVQTEAAQTGAAQAEGNTEAAPKADASGNDKLVVGFAQIGQESGWRDAETNDVQWYAARNTDTIELSFADAQQKQENQIKAIRNFIEMGVDVIVFPPVVETGWEAVLTECQEADIPVILVDRGIDPSAGEDLYTTMIASDHVWAGEQAAIVMDELLGGQGKVVELEGTVGASAAVQRKKGFDEYIAANCPDIEILDSQTGDFTRAMGKEVMESFLKTYDDIDAVFCHNDDMALGAIEAIKEAGKKPGEDVKIIGVDGVKGAFEAILAGEMNCTVECTPILAEQIFDTAAKLKNGETVDKWIMSADGVYTADKVTQEVVDGRQY